MRKGKSIVGKLRICLAIAASLVSLTTSQSWADTPSFQGVGDLPGGSYSSSPYGISPDGSVVVGSSTSSNGTEAFRWQNGTMSPLGDLFGLFFNSIAYAASSGGSYIAGLGTPGFFPPVIRAVRWQGGSISSLGDLPGGDDFSTASGISANGSVVVGVSASGNGAEAFRWQGGTMSGLGDLAGGTFESVATGVSADGSIVVGQGTSDIGKEAFVWQGGVMSGLGVVSAARAVSSDGTIVVGQVNDNEAFIFQDGVLSGLGDLPGGAVNSQAWDVSADGFVVVGHAESDSGDQAFIWTPATGMVALRDVLVNDFGLNLTGWSLTDARGVSDDGMTIVGHGTNPSGNVEGWIAHVNLYRLDLSVNDAARGTATAVPTPPLYLPGTAVTLSAQAVEGKIFAEWRIFDPNYPGDPNHWVTDSNNPTTLLMTSDQEVQAFFKCGSPTAPLLPMVLGILGLFAWLRRRT